MGAAAWEKSVTHYLRVQGPDGPAETQRKEHTRIIRLNIKRPQTVPLPLPPLLQPLLNTITLTIKHSNNRKRPKPVLRKLIQPHRLLHGIRRATLNLSAELRVQELD